MKPDGTRVVLVPLGAAGQVRPYYSMIRIRTGKLSSCSPFLATPSP